MADVSDQPAFYVEYGRDDRQIVQVAGAGGIGQVESDGVAWLQLVKRIRLHRCAHGRVRGAEMQWCADLALGDDVAGRRVNGARGIAPSLDVGRVAGPNERGGHFIRNRVQRVEYDLKSDWTTVVDNISSLPTERVSPANRKLR